ncbi:MAG TPA: methionyl-tRNA formyltransferase [Deltaproteobacteria bacterium]|nr:methionyl-tRNA formyltransferase [Deltaproteobacteria bacterium]
MRIAFMGTPAFAVPTLAALMSSHGHEIMFVLTQPDKPQGRGMHLQAPPVKDAALSGGLRVVQPERLRDNAEVRDLFVEARLDAAVVVAYGRLIPAGWLDIPRLGFINVHASLLPELRGAAPINRAILAGLSTTGVSIMQIEAAMDTGPVFARSETAITEQDDALTLSERLSVLGARTLMETLPLIDEGRIRPEPQDHARATYAPMLTREEGEIDWTQDLDTIRNMIRGLVPWPCAYTFLNGKMLKILQAVCEPGETGHPPGTLFKDRTGVRIACTGGSIVPQRLQVEGKKAVACDAFSCGLKTNRAILGR